MTTDWWWKTVACANCGHVTYYDWDICPNCGWSPKIEPEINVEVTMSIQYEICPLCGGWRWKWQPFDKYSDYEGTDASEMKPCGCPPEVRAKVKVEEEKKKQPQILICPSCGEDLHIFLEA